MTATFTAAGYIVQDRDGYAIHGIGKTAEAAWADTVANVDSFHDGHGEEITADEAREQFRTCPATQDLLDEVECNGGAIAWDVVDGIACTLEQARGDDE